MFRYATLALILAVAAACSSADRDEPAADAATAATTGPLGVSVTVSPTAGHAAAGMLTVTPLANGVRVTGRLTGLPADREVGFHIHETADCSAPNGASAGDHFNPTGQPHGQPASDQSHLGDLPNLRVDEDGVADVDVLVDGATLDPGDTRSLLDRAIVVHAQADDFQTQPAGGAGDRLACGEVPSMPDV